jgi:hypothetical protein
MSFGLWALECKAIERCVPILAPKMEYRLRIPYERVETRPLEIADYAEVTQQLNSVNPKPGQGRKKETEN